MAGNSRTSNPPALHRLAQQLERCAHAVKPCAAPGLHPRPPLRPAANSSRAPLHRPICGTGHCRTLIASLVGSCVQVPLVVSNSHRSFWRPDSPQPPNTYSLSPWNSMKQQIQGSGRSESAQVGKSDFRQGRKVQLPYSHCTQRLLASSSTSPSTGQQAAAAAQRKRG